MPDYFWQAVPAFSQIPCKVRPSRPYSHRKCKNPNDSRQSFLMPVPVLPSAFLTCFGKRGKLPRSFLL
jgi:hypothetical protein